jgi:tRNA(Arg) A34 adenosine deaminase TadA
MVIMKKVNTGILHTLRKFAEANDSDQTVRMAAAIVRNNKIISVGLNSKKSHPLQAKYGKNPQAVFLHAEIDAIKNALREIDIDDFAKCDLYICRVKKAKPFAKHYISGLAKPCAGCQRAIAAFGIKRVIYTTDDDDGYTVEEI